MQNIHPEHATLFFLKNGLKAIPHSIIWKAFDIKGMRPVRYGQDTSFIPH
jgi:hypothetical protein